MDRRSSLLAGLFNVFCALILGIVYHCANDQMVLFLCGFNLGMGATNLFSAMLDD